MNTSNNVRMIPIVECSSSGDDIQLPAYMQDMPKVSAERLILPSYSQTELRPELMTIAAGVVLRGELIVEAVPGLSKIYPAGEAFVEVIDQGLHLKNLGEVVVELVLFRIEAEK